MPWVLQRHSSDVGHQKCCEAWLNGAWKHWRHQELHVRKDCWTAPAYSPIKTQPGLGEECVRGFCFSGHLFISQLRKKKSTFDKHWNPFLAVFSIKKKKSCCFKFELLNIIFHRPFLRRMGVGLITTGTRDVTVLCGMWASVFHFIFFVN